MARTILHDGLQHPVTDAWHARNTGPWPHFAGLDLGGCQERRDAIYALDKAGLLTPTARLELWHLTHHINVRSAVRVLGADAHLKHGYATVDVLKGNRLQALCGCIVDLAVHRNELMAAACARDIVAPDGNPDIQAWRQYLWEHWAACNGDDPAHPEAVIGRQERIHPHRVLVACALHSHLKADPAALHAALATAA